MKKSDFEKIKPGDKLFRTMDIGKIILTVKSTFTSDFGMRFIIFEEQQSVRRWDGIYKCYNFLNDIGDNNHERSTISRNAS